MRDSLDAVGVVFLRVDEPQVAQLEILHRAHHVGDVHQLLRLVEHDEDHGWKPTVETTTGDTSTADTATARVDTATAGAAKVVRRLIRRRFIARRRIVRRLIIRPAPTPRTAPRPADPLSARPIRCHRSTPAARRAVPDPATARSRSGRIPRGPRHGPVAPRATRCPQ